MHGTADVVEAHKPEFVGLKPRFRELPGVRSIIRLNVSRIADSCGWTVAVVRVRGHARLLRHPNARARRRGHQGGPLAANMRGIDGLRGLEQRRYDASFGNTRSVNSMNVSWLSGDAMR
jgi:hypothetical protein